MLELRPVQVHDLKVRDSIAIVLTYQTLDPHDHYTSRRTWPWPCPPSGIIGGSSAILAVPVFHVARQVSSCCTLVHTSTFTALLNGLPARPRRERGQDLWRCSELCILEAGQ